MPVRMVQVGMGGWGQDWATVAFPRAAGMVEPVAWVDADAVTLAAARKRLGLPAGRCFPSLGAALAAVDAEAVLVTAQLAGHVPLAVEALSAGKHVLVEKPFAPDVYAAREAVEAAEAAGRFMMVSQNYRFFPAPRAVAALLAGGELGPVGAVAVDFRRDVGTGVPRHNALANPLLVDMAIHHFDLLRMILGQEATTVSCHAWNPPWSPFAGHANATAAIQFAGGAVASWRGSWVSPGEQTPWAGEWRVECAEGEIRWTSRDDRGGVAKDKVTIRSRTGKVREVPMPSVEPHGRAGALAAFAAAVESGTPPETSGRDNLGTLRLAFAAVASAASGRAVELLPDTA